MKYDFDKAIAVVKRAAKEELLPRFAQVQREIKRDGSFLTEADIKTQQRIANELKQAFPDIAFLGEEMPAEEQQRVLQSGSAVWCLDPVDGTSNFAAGIPYYAVSLALIEQGEAKFGVVYDPNRDECFTAYQGQGAYLNGQRLTVNTVDLPLSKCTALVDLKRLSKPLATKLATQAIYGSQRSFGSVALDWCWMAASRCHVYLHGKQNIWDYIAGNLIFTESGGVSSTLEGDAVFTHELIPRSAVGALDETLYKAWFSAITDI